MCASCEGTALSPSQLGHWQYRQLLRRWGGPSAEARTLNVTSCLELHLPWDRAAAICAANDLVQAHSPLRSTLIHGEPDALGLTPGFIAGTSEDVRVDIVDLEPKTSAERHAGAEFAATPLELESETTRILIEKTPKPPWYIYLKVHHVFTDALSQRLIERTFVRSYEARLNGQAPQLRPSRDLRHHSASHWAWLRSQRGQSQISELAQRLRKPLSPLLLTTIRGRNAHVQVELSIHSTVTKDPYLIQAVTSQAEARRVTPHVIMMAAYVQALGERTENGEVAVGQFVAARWWAEGFEDVGGHASPAVVRINTHDAAGWENLVPIVNRLNSQNYLIDQRIPIICLFPNTEEYWTNPPIYQSWFSSRHIRTLPYPTKPDSSYRSIPVERKPVTLTVPTTDPAGIFWRQRNPTLFADLAPDRLGLYFEYDSRLIAESAVEDLAQSTLRNLAAAAAVSR